MRPFTGGNAVRTCHVRLAGACLVLAALAGCGQDATRGGTGGAVAEASDPVQRLLDGNKRYVNARRTHPRETSERRAAVATGQKPFAIVLGCGDSRVPPEIVFDQGLGDLFVLRVAGNVADDAVVGSIEYAAEHLGATLVVVLGHERCGACDAALNLHEVPGHLHAVIDPIAAAVRETAADSGDRLDNVVRRHVRNVVHVVSESKPVLAHLVEERKLKVVGARYDLDTGEVEILK
jgi:carbonic anhydrase